MSQGFEAWDWVSHQPLPNALVAGAREIRATVLSGLRADEGLSAMGVEVASVRISDVSPTSEIEKALQLPTREKAISKLSSSPRSERRKVGLNSPLHSLDNIARRNTQDMGYVSGTIPLSHFQEI